MVVGEGFEPSKSMTADLQSAPFGRSGTPPRGKTYYKHRLLRRRIIRSCAPHPSGRCLRQRSLTAFESNLRVDDGRFAVSSLMYAREPHHGVKHIINIALRRRIIRSCAPHPSGRCLRQRSLTAFESNLQVDDGRFAVSSLMYAREPYHRVTHLLACFLTGKRGASYQMKRPCKALR